jgi:hypothetical protein
MPAVANWSPPYEFVLTNPYNGSMTFNAQLADRYYLLDKSGCKFTCGVRATKSNVPQADGSILHHRFLTGAEMSLRFLLWEEFNKPACDDLQADMLDELSGAFRSLLNAADNQGRLAWEVPGKNERMLDDARLLVYPEYSQDDKSGMGIVTVTIDTDLPYAQDLTQQLVSISDGGDATIDNTGTAESFPVYKVYGPTSTFTLANVTTGEQVIYSGTAISGGDYVELNTFKNTAFLNGDGADMLPSIDILSSLFPFLRTGNNQISIDGADVDVLWNPAWG